MTDAISNTSPLLYLQPLLKRAEGSGLWVSESVRHRILMLAGEGE